MTKTLDGFGKACPMPLVMAKKEIDEGCHDFAVQVDNETAVKNLTRLGKKSGLAVTCDVIDGGWLITYAEGDGTDVSDDAINEALAAGTSAGASGSGYAVFIGKDHVGEGDAELGRNLVKMALYTLSESDTVPVSLLFMNTGVQLVAGDDASVEEIVGHVKKLEERGCEVLVCGTCLDFYDLKEQLKVGEISNMYDILERMQEASKVITF